VQKEWLSVQSGLAEDWLALAIESEAFVDGAKGSR